MNGRIEEEIRKARQDLLNSVSHELNTPLTPVLIHLRHLQKRSRELEGDLEESVAVISRNIERLVERVQAMVEVAQLDSERFPVRMRTVPLDPLVDEALRDYMGVAEAAKVHLERQGTTDADVHADPVRLKEVMANLLDNAIRYTPAEGKVTVEVDSNNHNAQIQVKDTGVGFKEADKDRLFEPFSHIETEERDDYARAGLGLFISKGIIDLHGGEIDAQSAGPGQGSTFSFRIHVAQPKLLPIRWEDESKREVEFSKRVKDLV